MATGSQRPSALLTSPLCSISSIVSPCGEEWNYMLCRSKSLPTIAPPLHEAMYITISPNPSISDLMFDKVAFCCPFYSITPLTGFSGGAYTVLMPGRRLTDRDYTDDIALLASSFGGLQPVSRVNEIANSVGLSINTRKTKLLSSCIPDQEKAPLEINGCIYI
ncbi:unnamed protein product [Schistocephalus solidus]|uniref:Reverse transcriptase domain-containing protein n=1 Tax=Schistocephalus solidus TaxID=70667 RepID=A0A183T0A4_SCHSO|nr:unnamed protein product [Schistocephalus solidus]